MIDRLIAALAPGPQVEAARCLAGCTRCVQACPTGALERGSAGAPMLDVGRCTGCGACAAACPTGAITLAEFDLAALRLVLQEAPEMVLTCRRQPRRKAATVPCLAGVPAEFLAALALERQQPVAVVTAGCAGCPLGAGEQVAAAVQAAAALVAGLASAGGGAVVALAAAGPATAPELVVPRPSGEAGPRAGSGPGLNRRALLRLWGRGLTRAAAAGLPELSDAPGQNLPPVSRYLLRVLPPTPPQAALQAPAQEPPPAPAPGGGEPGTARAVPASGLPLAHYLAEAGCTACGLCVRRCPTGALQVVREGYTARLEHHLRQCLDCGLCLPACPTNALYRADMVDLQDLQTGLSRLAAQVEASTCRGCGRPFAPTSGEVECSQCQSRRSLLVALRLGPRSCANGTAGH